MGSRYELLSPATLHKPLETGELVPTVQRALALDNFPHYMSITMTLFVAFEKLTVILGICGKIRRILESS